MNRYTSLAQKIRFAHEWVRDAMPSAEGDPGAKREALQMAESTCERYASHQPAILRRRTELTQQAFALALSLQQRLIAQVHEEGRAPASRSHHFTAPLAGMDGLARLLTPHIGLARLLEGQMPAFRRSIRSAVAGLLWHAGQAAPAANQSRVIAFHYDRPGPGEPFALCVPLSEFLPVEGHDWPWLAETAGYINLPIRAASGWIDPEPGSPAFSRQAQICLIDTSNAVVDASVPVVAARPAEGGYRFTRPGEPAHRIDWVERSVSVGGALHTGNVIIPPVPLIEPLAPGVPVRSDDYIVVFPDSAGIEPLYVLFKGAREYPSPHPPT
ncbi:MULTISPECIES: S-type pyocin domain-containing protein [unclassified Pseudomonas]|uniref:S-type pyocin domain-containing protein n=1 Tax=unclassified Pseudomonas TaxID=196821 RepID=UPI0021152E8E|nr:MULTISPECIES: S-type pyocin domain-containing protein [unclassified Pseudomonas]